MYSEAAQFKTNGSIRQLLQLIQVTKEEFEHKESLCNLEPESDHYTL